MRLRISAIWLFSFLATCGLIAKLYTISILDHESYVARAKDQQNVVLDMVPKRGDVFLQDYASNRLTVAAQSVAVFTLSATPKFVENKPEYAALFAKTGGLKYEDVLATLEDDSMYMNPIKKGMSQTELEQFAKGVCAIERKSDPSFADVKVNLDEAQGDIIYYLNGIFFVKSYKRTYPEGQLMGQLMGFVNEKGEGQYGVEAEYNTQLQGYSGRVKLERDSAGNLLSQNEASKWQNGSSYELSIDRNIQYYVEQELAAQIKESEAISGSVIIMNPKNGEILAMANQPTYDPNNYQETAKNNISLFDNASISQIWEPGSIMKPLVMASAIDLNLVQPQTKNVFQASVTVEGYVINTALRKAYGEETMTQVLTNSDNVAMVWVAEKLGNKNMYNYLTSFGLGKSTGIDLQNEVTGSVLAQEQWRDINRATISFGQGIATTPIQILTAYSAIVNNGKILYPKIVKAVTGPEGKRSEIETKVGPQVLKPETAKLVKDMMVATVVNGHARAGVNGYKVGGKTGTAQIPDSEKGGYVDEAYNHSFIGFGPSDDPQYLMLVKIDRPNIKKVGLYAEYTAVPLFGKISQFLVNYYQIPPTNR